MKKKDTISHRQDRVASLIQAAVMDTLRKGRMMDERLIGYPLTVTRVSVTPDLKLATCYFLPFNTNLSEQDLSDALQSSARSIRISVTEKINLKYSPEIRFFYDKTFDNVNQVDLLLKKIKE